MKEFQIQVGQSLVDKTLDNFEYNPLVVVNFPNQINSLFENTLLVNDEIVEGIEEGLHDYIYTSLKLVEDEFDLNQDLDLQEDGGSQLQPKFLYNANPQEYDYINQDFSSQDSIRFLEEQISLEELEDATIFATDLVAQYVIQSPSLFDQETIKEAEIILNRESPSVYKNMPLGFGKFLKRVWRKVKNVANKIGRWIGRQIKRVIGFGKPEIKRLEIHQYGRPDVKLSNPITINKLNINVAKLKVQVPYYIKWPWDKIRWNKIRITISDKLGAVADGEYHLGKSGLKITVTPRFKKLRIKVKIIGIKFEIGLTHVANKILENHKFEIYDVSTLAKPMTIKGLIYEVRSLDPVGLPRGIRLDIAIDVKK